MLIGGWQKFTTLDYPGKIAAALFTSGCNFRCPYCHNAELVLPELIRGQKIISENQVWNFLYRRVGQLEGVCVSGGEPTLQADLLDFLRKLKTLGYAVKLDTNGARPEMAKEIVRAGLVDHWAVDIKTAFSKYDRLAAGESGRAAACCGEKVLETLALIAESGVPLELRTTMVPTLVGAEDFDEIIARLNQIDAGFLGSVYRYALQTFRPQKTLDPRLGKIKPYGDAEMEAVKCKLEKFGAPVELIG